MDDPSIKNPAMGSVGDEATWEWKVKPEVVQMYAQITGDENPLHFDKAYAESTRFGGLITHGGTQAGALNALVAQKLPGPGTVFLKQELDYTNPVRVGDTLTAKGKIIWVHAKKPVCHMEVVVTATPEDAPASSKEALRGKVVLYRALPK